MEQFQRAYSVTIETIQFSELDVAFTVRKTLEPEPNTCDLTVWNLNAEHRHQLAQLGTPMVEIMAGYKEEFPAPGLIFRGELREVTSYRQESEWITELHSGDGEKQLKDAKINKSYKAGIRLSVILKDLIDKLGVGLGNSQRKILEASFDAARNEVIKGTVVSGRAVQKLNQLLLSGGFEWSVQDGELQLIELGAVLSGTAVKLTPETGLIGSPTIAADKTLKLRSLMNGQIVPGRQLYVRSSEIPEGYYRAEICEYTGNTAGQEWYVDITAEAI